MTGFTGEGRQGSGEVTGVMTVTLSASSLGPDDAVARGRALCLCSSDPGADPNHRGEQRRVWVSGDGPAAQRL